ncbi:exopolysaccharide biosynthesis protein [Azospirillum sp. sgz302134]
MSDGRPPESPEHRLGTDAAAESANDARRNSASALLEDFLAHDHDVRIALGDLMGILGDRAFGALLLFLSIPNVLPVPGLSTVTGLPMILIGAQMAAGRDRPWLPRKIAAATVDRDAFLRVIARAHPYVDRLERHLRPRLPGLTSPTAERLLGLAVVVLATILALPIVFGNQPPAFAIALIALGLIEKDGAFVAAGLAAGVVAIAIVAAVLLGLGQAAMLLIHKLFG